MDISKMSEKLLRKMHDGIREAMDKDDKDPRPLQDKEFGVRFYKDWKETADALEAEMTKRKMPFTKIKW
jgi:hypothetical protein